MSSPSTAVAAREDNVNIRVHLDAERLAALPPHVREPIIAFHAEITGSREWIWKRVQDEIGYDSSTMSRVFRGVYTGNHENVARAIAAFFEKQAAAAAPSEFVRTRIAATIFNAIDYARANHVSMIVMGAATHGLQMQRFVATVPIKVAMDAPCTVILVKQSTPFEQLGAAQH